MLRHAEPAQANLWVLRSPLHHMQLLPTTAVTRYQACTRRVSPHLRPSPAQIQVRSSGLRGHAGTLSYPDRRTRKGKPIYRPPNSQADRRPTSTQNRPEGDEAINPCCGRKVLPFRTVISASALLRFQCLFEREALREAALHAPKPGKARPGVITRTMALEQLPRLHVRRAEYREDR